MRSQTEFTELTSRSNLGFRTIEMIDQISQSKSKQGFETIKKMKGGENG